MKKTVRVRNSWYERFFSWWELKFFSDVQTAAPSSSRRFGLADNGKERHCLQNLQRLSGLNRCFRLSRLPWWSARSLGGVLFFRIGMALTRQRYRFSAPPILCSCHGSFCSNGGSAFAEPHKSLFRIHACRQIRVKWCPDRKPFCFSSYQRWLRQWPILLQTAHGGHEERYCRCRRCRCRQCRHLRKGCVLQQKPRLAKR